VRTRCAISTKDTDQSDLFLAYTTATVAGFPILAIIWAATPALFLSPCT
jgi:hypothetical protein